MHDSDWNGLRSRIMNILMSEACQKINFTCEGITIDGAGYSFVALALVNKPSKLGGMRFAKDVAPDAEAMYDANTRTFYFKSPNYAMDPTSEEGLTIVHECTHALIGALKGTKILRSTNETCAFVAEQIYNIHSGYHAPQDDDHEPFQLAHRMLATANKWNYTGAYALYPSDIAAIKSWLLKFESYKWMKGNPTYTDKNPGLRLS
jgi:hypothetical protein